MFARDDFSGRGRTKMMKEIRFFKRLRGGQKDCPGVIQSEGDTWKEQRRFTLHHLRDLGFGRTSIEVVVNEEFKELSERMITEASTGSISSTMLFNLSVANVLWGILSGKRFDMKNSKQLERLKKLDRILSVDFSPSNPRLIIQRALPPWIAEPFGEKMLQK